MRCLKNQNAFLVLIFVWPIFVVCLNVTVSWGCSFVNYIKHTKRTMPLYCWFNNWSRMLNDSYPPVLPKLSHHEILWFFRINSWISARNFEIVYSDNIFLYVYSRCFRISLKLQIHISENKGKCSPVLDAWF